jgi:hypothetical protein
MKKLNFFISLFLFCAGTAVFAQGEPVESIIKFLRTDKNYSSAGSRNFIYNAIDLNDDGKDEYLVGLTGMDWCGSGGCTMLVFDHNVKLNTRMTVVEYPVYVGAPGGSEVTKGYSNIYIENRDGTVSKMAWNGTKYPTNPSVAPKVDKSILKDKFKFLNIQEQDQVSY